MARPFKRSGLHRLACEEGCGSGYCYATVANLESVGLPRCACGEPMLPERVELAILLGMDRESSWRCRAAIPPLSDKPREGETMQTMTITANTADTPKTALERVNFRIWDKFLNEPTPGYAAPGTLVDIGAKLLPVRVCRGVGNKVKVLAMTPSPGGAETTPAHVHEAVMSWLLDGAPEDMEGSEARVWARRALARLDVEVELYDADGDFLGIGE